MPIKLADRYKLIFEEHRFASDFRAKIISAWFLIYAALAAGVAWAQTNPNAKPVSSVFCGLAFVVTALMWSADLRHRTALLQTKLIGKRVEEATEAEIPPDQRYFATLVDHWFTHSLVIDILTGFMLCGLGYATYSLGESNGELSSIFPQGVRLAIEGGITGGVLHLSYSYSHRIPVKKPVPSEVSVDKVNDDGGDGDAQ